MFFYRDKKINKKHNSRNDACGRHKRHHKNDLRFFRVKQVGAGQADTPGQQRGTHADASIQTQGKKRDIGACKHKYDTRNKRRHKPGRREQDIKYKLLPDNLFS